MGALLRLCNWYLKLSFEDIQLQQYDFSFVYNLLDQYTLPFSTIMYSKILWVLAVSYNQLTVEALVASQPTQHPSYTNDIIEPRDPANAATPTTNANIGPRQEGPMPTHILGEINDYLPSIVSIISLASVGAVER